MSAEAPGPGSTPALAQREYDREARGPLHGVRVLDLSRVVAGNMVSLALADFGADVIKIEGPEGDALRDWKVAGVATNWKVYARNKRSLCLDLRRSEAIGVVLDLAAQAQVLVENFRPGTLERMGLGPQVLHGRNPALVIVRVTGWGQDGPYRHKPGFGTLAEGMSGFAALNGFEDREPVLPPMQLADCSAGLYGAFATLVALREVEVKAGAGQVIDVSLFEPLFSLMGPQAASYRASGQLRRRTGSRSTTAAPRNAYRTADGGWVCLSASTQAMTERLLRAIGRPELVDDPRFRTNADRLRHSEALDEVIAGFVAGRTLAENLAFFDREEVTVGPIYDIAQIMQDRFVIEREVLADYPDEELGRLPMHCVVPRLSATPGAIRSPAPGLGEHGEAILREAGFDPARIEQWRRDGVLRGSQATQGVGRRPSSAKKEGT